MRHITLLLLLPLLARLGAAQTAPAAAAPAAPETSQAPNAAQPTGPGKVLFSRSTETPAASPSQPAATVALAGKASAAATDEERSAPTFTSYDLDVHLVPAQSSMTAQARLTLRNDGPVPLARLPLQLSSTLHMERVLVAGKALPVTRQTVESDADHTGSLEETLALLPQPVAPGASLQLTVEYSGTIAQSSARLDRMQIPSEVAAQSDWDSIGEAFTGLRGFGDTVWYPVASVPALLGDGAKLFAEIGRQRARNQEAQIALRVTDEFAGAAPNIAVLAGHVLALGAPQQAPSGSFPGVLTVALAPTRLGFRTPSLFLAERTASPATKAQGGSSEAVVVYATPEHAADALGYSTAATLAEPLLAQWLGTRAHPPLAVIDLPVEGAQASEQGDALLVSLVAAEPAQIAGLLAGELARPRFRSPRPWLQEGVPAFLGALYAEASEGHPAALERLASTRAALAFIEPASPGAGAGEDLLHASDAIYYRAKALDVLWMLRDLAGDKPLSAALRAYDPAADTQPDYFEKLVEGASSKDLRWFFDAWVYRDLGLPDLSIANVYPTRARPTQGAADADQWLVTIDIANDGYAEAEVPVTLRSAQASVTERVRIAGRGKVSRRMLIAGEPTSVEVNDGSVPEVQASVHQRMLESAPARQ